MTPMLRQLRFAANNPSKTFNYLQQLCYDFYFSQIHNHNGVDFMSQDWDNLLLLDGCRYDLFKEANNLDGELTPIQSPASETDEFLEKTVGEKKFPGTVYFTANPQITKTKTKFHDIHHLWDELWDENLNTVHPAKLTDYVLDHVDDYPQKRLFVHFVQPHIPFIGPTGQRIDQSPFQGGVMSERSNKHDYIWNMLREGNITKQTVWKAYRENLKIGLQEAERLVSELDGKTVITSDHGNSIGEWGIYGHAPNRHIESLTKVPWFERPTNERKIITEGEVMSGIEMKNKDTTNRDVKDRLAALGYR